MLLSFRRFKLLDEHRRCSFQGHSQINQGRDIYMLNALFNLPDECLSAVELLCKLALGEAPRLSKLAQEPAQDGMLLPRCASNRSSQLIKSLVT